MNIQQGGGTEEAARREVVRYDVYDDQGRQGSPLIEVDGEWVKFADYAALRAQLVQYEQSYKAIIGELKIEKQSLAQAEGKLIRLQEFINKSVYGRELEELKTQLAQYSSCHCCGKPIIEQAAFVKCPTCDMKACEKLAQVTQQLSLSEFNARDGRNGLDRVERELAQVTAERDRLANPIEHADYFAPQIITLEQQLAEANATIVRLEAKQ